MLVYILAIAVAAISLIFYLVSFFFPEIHRRDDFFWSGVGFFYALVLWVCAGQIGGAVLLSQTAAVGLIFWFGWETLRLRRAIANPAEKTEIPENSYLTQSLQKIVGVFRRQPKPKIASEVETVIPASQQVAVAESTSTPTTIDDTVAFEETPQDNVIITSSDKEAEAELESSTVAETETTSEITAGLDDQIESQSESDSSQEDITIIQRAETENVSEAEIETRPIATDLNDQIESQSESDSSQEDITIIQRAETENVSEAEIETRPEAIDLNDENSTSEVVENLEVEDIAVEQNQELNTDSETNITESSDVIDSAQTSATEDSAQSETIDNQTLEKDSESPQVDESTIAPSTETLIQNALIEEAESRSSKPQNKPKSKPASTTKKAKPGFSFGGMFGRLTGSFQRKKKPEIPASKPTSETTSKKKPDVEDEPWDTEDIKPTNEAKPAISTDNFITVEVDPNAEPEIDDDFDQEINPSAQSETPEINAETLPIESKLKDNIETDLKELDNSTTVQDTEKKIDSELTSSVEIETPKIDRETLPPKSELDQTKIESDIIADSDELLDINSTQSEQQSDLESITVSDTVSAETELVENIETTSDQKQIELVENIETTSDEEVIIIVPDDSVEVNQTITFSSDQDTASEVTTETSTSENINQVQIEPTELDATEIKVDESSLPPISEAKELKQPPEDVIDVKSRDITPQDNTTQDN